MPYFILFLCLFAAKLTALIDLDTMEQPFVLEAKRIQIPGYPDAFNPSIVEWEDKLLMSFRSRNPSNNLANLVGFTWLDKDFNPIGEVQLLEMIEGTEGSYIQDPRLLVIKNKLYMAYSDLIENEEEKIKKRTMCMAEIIYEGAHFQATHLDYFQEFEGNKNNKFEKNWIPFNYKQVLLLAYTISPHKIFLPISGENRCVVFAQSSNCYPWNWGELRGGTTALQIGNYYLAFFHSSLPLATVQSNAQSMPHYFMGAYLFENQPPFSIKKISPSPIINKDFYNGEDYQTWKPLRVIFPCGFIHDSNYIWISYGRQDHEAWIVKLDKAGLLKSLVPVESHF